MSESKKIAVLGGPDTVLPFRSIGAEAYQVDTPEELAQTLRKLADEGKHGIIFVEENLGAPVAEVIASINNQYRGLSVTPIPGTTGQGGWALKRLTSQVTRAIGMDIFAQNGGN